MDDLSPQVSLAGMHHLKPGRRLDLDGQLWGQQPDEIGGEVLEIPLVVARVGVKDVGSDIGHLSLAHWTHRDCRES